MLIELFGKNFGCFRDEFRLSMLATDIDRESDRGIVRVKVDGDDEPLELLRSVAIYGPNASGKSTVIRAAQVLQALIHGSSHLPSDAPLRNYEPFALGGGSREPVRLGVKALIDRNVYEYVVEFDRVRFHSERLSRFSPVEEIEFERSGQQVAGRWTTHEQFRLLASSFRPNALLLSLADSLSPDLARSVAVGFRRLLSARESVRTWADQMSPHGVSTEHVALRAINSSEFRRWLQSMLQSADIGVEDYEIDEVWTDGPHGGSALGTWHELTLLHRASEGNVRLPFHRESTGTRRLVELSPLLFDLSHSQENHAEYIDEIDASVHPTLLREMLHHFNCELPMDQVRGQLVFTTHETALMDDEAKRNVLRRDQIYFTKKDADGAASLYSLAEFKERNNLNLRRRYLQGRYGALPMLGTFSR